MVSIIKKYFIGAMFFALNAAFAVQLAYVIILAVRGTCEDLIGDFGWLAGEWLALTAARYLSARIGGGNHWRQHNGHNGNNNNAPRRF